MEDISNADKLKNYFDTSKKQSTLPSFNATDSVNSFLSNMISTFKATKPNSEASLPFLSSTTNKDSVDDSSSTCPSFSKKQRAIGFILCFLLGTFCMSIASLYIPLLVLKARKFALLYGIGSVFLIGSFAFLWGPWKHFKHLIAIERLPFTLGYFLTLFATIYSAAWLKSTLLTIFFASAQILAVIWYFVSYIPGGNTGMKFFLSLFKSVASRAAKTTLDV